MFNVSVLVLERKNFFREKNLQKIKIFEIFKFETPLKIQFSTLFRFSFFLNHFNDLYFHFKISDWQKLGSFYFIS